jgi:hypothetical protein
MKEFSPRLTLEDESRQVAKGRLVFGRIILGLLIAFALAGVHHTLRLVSASSSTSLNDLYPVWRGSRELLVHHRDPYSQDVSEEIQTAFYGSPLPPGEYVDKECCFAYPVYHSFLFAPAVGADFAKVSRVFFWLLAAATAASVACWWFVTGHDMRLLPLIMALVLVSPPVAQGLDLHQLTLLVAALLSISAALLRSNHAVLAGIVLACATIKPHMAFLPICWLLLWAVSDWTNRKNLAVGFAVTMALLFAASEIVMPRWLPSFLAQLYYYRNHAGQGVLDILYGRRVALWLTGVCMLGVLFLMWRRRRAHDFMPMLAFVLAVEVFIMPGLKSLLNLVLLMPLIFLVLRKYPAKAIRSNSAGAPQWS